MEAMENLLTRRSIRKFKPQQITDAELEAVLNAGKYAPTAKGSQSPLMIAVQDKGDIARLSSLNAQIMGTDSDPFYGAPTVVVVFAQAGNRNGVQDASLVMGNMMNAAHALGLGSCWINQLRECCDDPKVRALLTEYGVPEDHIVVCSAAVGYIAKETPAKPRKEGLVSFVE